MRKFALIFLLFPLVVLASDVYYGLGLRNSKYASISIEQKNGWGIAVENSLFAQDLNFQYVRFAPFYNFTAPLGFNGRYVLYGGFRYDQNFYDIGAMLSVNWEALKKYLQVQGVFQPYYDSDLGQKNGYSVGIQSILLQEVGLIAGIKNLPEYRDTEQRFFGGLVFCLPHMTVIPEISTPARGHIQTTRFSVSFLYKNGI